MVRVHSSSAGLPVAPGQPVSNDCALVEGVGASRLVLDSVSLLEMMDDGWTHDCRLE